MEHRDPAVELRLDRWITGNRETYFTELSDVTCGMLIFVLSKSTRGKNRAAGNYHRQGQDDSPHKTGLQV